MPRKYSQEEFLEMARKGNPILQVCGVYQGMQKKIDCKCLRCNRVMAKKAQDVIKGIGCRYCAKTQTSFAELFLAKAIQQTDENIRVLQRDRSAIGEELDIYLPDYQFAVEPGAWYYHKKRLTTDIRKHEKCEQKGIFLWIIYDNFKEIDSALVENYPYISVYEKPLSQNIELTELREIVKKMLSHIGKTCSFTESDWIRIRNDAVSLSYREALEESAKRIQDKLPHIEFVSIGVNESDENTRVKCTVCGNEWSTSLVSLRRSKKSGCRKCEKTQLKHPKEYEEELGGIYPNIKLRTMYMRSGEPVQYYCIKCGNNGSQIASRLLESGCQKCSRLRKSKMMTKTHEAFIEELHERNPEIKVVGVYKGDREHILVRCEKCGNEWSPIAGDILRGHGCNRCRRKQASERRKKPVQCIEAGIIYESLKEAEKKTGVNKDYISLVCRGKKKSAGGFTWCYVQ